MPSVFVRKAGGGNAAQRQTEKSVQIYRNYCGLSLIHILRRLCREEVIKDDRLCGAWIQVLLAHFFKKIVFLEAEGPENLDLTCRLVQYIMEHFQEPLTLEGLAAKLHVNKYYLSHTFSGRLQMNFREYLNRIRLEYAVQLLSLIHI